MGLFYAEIWYQQFNFIKGANGEVFTMDPFDFKLFFTGYHKKIDYTQNNQSWIKKIKEYDHGLKNKIDKDEDDAQTENNKKVFIW